MENDKSALFIKLILIKAAVSAVNLVVFFNLGLPMGVIVPVIDLVFFTPLMALAELRGYFRFSRYLLVLSCLFVIFITQLGLPQTLSLEYYYLIVMMVSVIIFNAEQKIDILIAILLPLVVWGLTVFLPPIHLPVYLLPRPDFPYRSMQIGNQFGSFFVAAVFIYYYTKHLEEGIASLKKAESQLLNTAKLVSLGEMAGGVAHEINNPLAIIHLTMNRLQKLVESNAMNRELGNKSLATIAQATQRISGIVKGLHAFANNSDKDPFVRVSAQSVIEDTLALCTERYRAAGISLVFQTNEEGAIECRPSQISQLLMNLLSNAFDAVITCEEKKIKIELTVDERNVTISVIDNGKGVPIEIRDKIMLPFFTTKPVNKGTGLGLSISLGIAEEHGGTLTFDVIQNETRFHIKFPRKRN